MKLFFRNIFVLLSFSAAVCSCSMAMGNIYDNEASGRILITGTVSELGSALPLKDIKITFKAYPANGSEVFPVFTDEVYSGYNGIYAIEASVSDMPLLCTIMAEDTTGTYESQTHEISVTWSGPSYDKKNNSFVVNDSHFQLSRIRITSF